MTVVTYVPLDGMRRMFEECRAVWGEPDKWPAAVRTLVCETRYHQIWW